jgi:[acyl-carrier-protein] S-malonyltransferase
MAFSNPADIKRALVEQLYRPVRWIETVEKIARDGVSNIVECVPGKILTGLNKRIDATLNCVAITDMASIEAALLVLTSHED